MVVLFNPNNSGNKENGKCKKNSEKRSCQNLTTGSAPETSIKHFKIYGNTCSAVLYDLKFLWPFWTAS